MAKKVVVFDFDGTLADSLPVLLESYNAIASRFRLLPVTKDDVRDLRKLTYKEMFKKVGLRPYLLPMIIRAGTKELRKREDTVKLFDGIPKLLNDLLKEGHQVGVLTSNHSDVVARVLELHKVTGVDFIVSQRSVFSKHKAFRRLEKVHGLSPDGILYVGDEYRDVIACRKVGVKIIGVTWGFGGREAFEREEPDAVVDTIAQLKKAIDLHQ